MLAKLLAQYSKVQLIALPQEFSAPKETKLEEINYVLNKVNKENFYELCDIEYRDILEDRLYLFPETKINFIVAIDKMFKSYVAIINKYFIKGKPMKDHHVKAFVVDNDMVNPLDPELWNKNAAKYFTERIQQILSYIKQYLMKYSV